MIFPILGDEFFTVSGEIWHFIPFFKYSDEIEVPRTRKHVNPLVVLENSELMWILIMSAAVLPHRVAVVRLQLFEIS